MIEQGISAENLAALYADPLILRTGDDEHPAVPVEHELAEYWSVFDGEQFVGAYLVIDYSAYEWEVHTLLQKAATRISREAGRRMLDILFEDPVKQRVTGWVRGDIRTAINLCLKLGLIVEGIKLDAVQVDGEPLPLIMMGVTRSKWESMR